jgi:hypothetical protein
MVGRGLNRGPSSLCAGVQWNVAPGRYLPPMSCVELADRHRAVLAALAQRQPVPEGIGDVFEELVEWGWVLASGELTGAGHRHAGDIAGGLVGRPPER